MKKALTIIGAVLITLCIGAYFALTFAAESFVKKQLDSFSEEYKQLGTLKYDDVSVSLFKLDLAISGIQVTPKIGNPIVLDRIVLKHFAPGKTQIPEALSVSLQGIHINARELGPNGMQLLELGYDNLLGNVDVDFEYDSANKEVIVNNFGYGAKQVGDVSMKLHLSNLDLENLNMMSLLMGGYSQINFHSASFVYNDDSFIERSLKVAATKSQKSPEQILKEAEMAIDQELAKAKDDFSKNVLNQLKAYIHKPGSITITADPKQKITLKEIQQIKVPQDLVERLKVKVVL